MKNWSQVVFYSNKLSHSPLSLLNHLYVPVRLLQWKLDNERTRIIEVIVKSMTDWHWLKSPLNSLENYFNFFTPVQDCSMRADAYFRKKRKRKPQPRTLTKMKWNALLKLFLIVEKWELND